MTNEPIKGLERLSRKIQVEINRHKKLEDYVVVQEEKLQELLEAAKEVLASNSLSPEESDACVFLIDRKALSKLKVAITKAEGRNEK